LTDFQKIIKCNENSIRQVGVELFHAGRGGGRMDRQTWRT